MSSRGFHGRRRNGDGSLDTVVLKRLFSECLLEVGALSDEVVSRRYASDVEELAIEIRAIRICLRQHHTVLSLVFLIKQR